MKHLQAGLIVGAATFVVAILVVLAWGLLSWVVGETSASIVLLLAVGVAIIAAAIDWLTERKA